jgi:hypothetical protein
MQTLEHECPAAGEITAESGNCPDGLRVTAEIITTGGTDWCRDVSFRRFGRDWRPKTVPNLGVVPSGAKTPGDVVGRGEELSPTF